MARAGLGWTLQDLAEHAGINSNTISRFEVGRDILSGKLHRLEETLREAGVVFHEEGATIGVSVAVRPLDHSRPSPKKKIRVRARLPE